MPAPKSVGLGSDWEYMLRVFMAWEALRAAHEPHFIKGIPEQTLEQTFEWMMSEGRRGTVLFATEHACPVTYGTMNKRSGSLFEVSAELALRMPGAVSPIDSIRLSSDGDDWALRSPLDTNGIPTFAGEWTSGRSLFREMLTRAKRVVNAHLIIVQPEQVPHIIDWMCMEAERLDPLLRTIFSEQP